MSVTVVICAYNAARAGQLVDAVRSVAGQSHRADEVIVVIDHAPDLLGWAVRHVQGARVIENTNAPGLSGARNCGVAAASGDLVAFLDDDARAANTWLEHLVAPFSDARVGATGGTVLADWEAPRPAWMPEEFDWVVGCSYRGLPQQRAVVRNVIGCSMAFRRTAIEAAGGFATNLGRVGARPLGCEETDLCIRLGHVGMDVVYTPAATVQHRVPRSRATMKYFVSRCYSEGISKRQVTRRNGTQSGLASERRYVTHTLPEAMVTALRRGDRDGLTRAAAIGLGLAAAGVGYVRAPSA